MAIYMSQFSYTAEALAALVKNPVDRSVAVRALAESAGGRMIAFSYSLGEYDGVVISEAPDETTVTAFIMAAIAPGHLRAFKTTVLLTPEQALEAMKKAASLSFQRPGQ